jgi:hypothetical protein
MGFGPVPIKPIAAAGSGPARRARIPIHLPYTPAPNPFIIYAAYTLKLAFSPVASFLLLASRHAILWSDSPMHRMALSHHCSIQRSCGRRHPEPSTHENWQSRNVARESVGCIHRYGTCFSSMASLFHNHLLYDSHRPVLNVFAPRGPRPASPTSPLPSRARQARTHLAMMASSLERRASHQAYRLTFIV